MAPPQTLLGELTKLPRRVSLKDRCKMQGAGCGEVSTRKMRGELRGVGPQFTRTDARYRANDCDKIKTGFQIYHMMIELSIWA